MDLPGAVDAGRRGEQRHLASLHWGDISAGHTVALGRVGCVLLHENVSS